MSICCEDCVLSGRGPLRRADHSSRGLLPSLVRRCVWSRIHVNEEALAQWGLMRPKKGVSRSLFYIVASGSLLFLGKFFSGKRWIHSLYSRIARSLASDIASSLIKTVNLLQTSLLSYSFTDFPVSWSHRVEFLFKWQWNRFFSEYFGFPLSVIIPPTPSIHLSIIWTDYVWVLFRPPYRLMHPHNVN